MGVTLDFRLIDHERIVVGGLAAVNEAIRRKDPQILRDYLLSLPVEVVPEVVEQYTYRLGRLRTFEAPDIIIQNEERFLELARGDAYQPAKINAASFDELRSMLGTWCWVNHTYSLDKTWQELHWFLEPVAGPVYPTVPQYAEVGDPAMTVFTQAMKGAIPYPKDDLGDPIIRTLGSPEPDSAYSPPANCAVILEALRHVDSAAWTDLCPFRRELYKRAGWDLSEDDIDRCVEDELSVALDALPILVAAYTKAVERGYGVSCEYSL